MNKLKSLIGKESDYNRQFVSVPKSNQEFEIFGRIKSIYQYPSKNDSNWNFDLETEEGNIMNCMLNYNIELSYHDNVHGYVKQIQSSNQIIHVFVKRPLVQIGTSEAAIKDFIKRTLIKTGCGDKMTDHIYVKLLEIAKIGKERELFRNGILKKKGYPIKPIDPSRNTNEGEIQYYICEMSREYQETRQNSCLAPLIESGLKPEQCKLLIEQWYLKRQLRKIKLFDLTVDELENNVKSLDELYNDLITNPYKVPFIDLSKADQINTMLNLQLEPNYRNAGEIVRYIFKYSIKNGAICINIRSVLRSFNYLGKLKELLQNEFEIVYFENDKDTFLYFKYYDKVEQDVADFISDMCIRNAEQYDSNLQSYIESICDEPSDSHVVKTVPMRNVNGKLVQTIIPYYIRKTLVPEQKNAIINSLNSVISFITGGAGTGKCLEPNTPIKMFSGEIKLCKDIAIGDQLMGDDLTPRNVRSICSGYDNMYKLKYDTDSYYICNNCHLVTIVRNNGIMYEIEAQHLINMDLKQFKLANSLTKQKYTFTIEKIEYGKYNGFEIDGNRRFLLGDGIITHNTSLLDEITNSLILNNVSFQLTAFMGAAVERMNKATDYKYQAATIHRLIAVQSSIKPFDIALIDEAGTVDTHLLYKFIKAFPNCKQIIFFGDVNQMPPIGVGRLIRQLVDSKRIPVFRLIDNHRIKKSLKQEEECREAGIVLDKKDKNNDAVILNNANWLIDEKRDLNVPFAFVEADGFTVIKEDLPEVQLKIIEHLLQGFKDEGVPEDKICVMCPYNKELIQINRIVQDIFRPDEIERIAHKSLYNRIEQKFESYEVKYRIDDRVMSTSTNNSAKIYNGTEGKIVEITNKACIIQFEHAKFMFAWAKDEEYRSRKNQYQEDIEDTNLSMLDIEHSFGSTINKYQGKEKEHCIIYIPKRVDYRGEISRFVTINSYYTAITRTQETVWTISSKEVLDVVTSTKEAYRAENLAYRLQKLRKSSIEDKVNKLTDPEYVSAIILEKEEEIEPQDFFDECPDW